MMGLLLNKEDIKREIDKVEDQKVLQAIQTILDYANAEANDIWEDEAFVSELKQRSADLKSGKDKGFTWEQTKAAARKKVKASKRA